MTPPEAMAKGIEDQIIYDAYDFSDKIDDAYVKRHTPLEKTKEPERRQWSPFQLIYKSGRGDAEQLKLF